MRERKKDKELITGKECGHDRPEGMSEKILMEGYWKRTSQSILPPAVPDTRCKDDL